MYCTVFNQISNFRQCNCLHKAVVTLMSVDLTTWPSSHGTVYTQSRVRKGIADDKVEVIGVSSETGIGGHALCNG